MSFIHPPASLAKFCRTTLPIIQRSMKGSRIRANVAAIQETDQWNSFDRFHGTSDTLVKLYEVAGADAEVHAIPTGGRIGSGRWVIHEAEDIRSATVDIIKPFRQRLLDYKKNPWHIIQWSGATNARGVTGELIVIDTIEELERMRPERLNGKILLTRLFQSFSPHILTRLGKTRLAAVISDRPIPNNPHGVAWTKFGWGGLKLTDAAIQLPGFVLSGHDGDKLRQQLKKHGTLTLCAKADIRRYAGTHDVVSGIVRGRDDPQDEVWAISHSSEPGALDNASGVAACVETAQVIESLIRAGKIERPRRSIRLVSGYECYGFFGYLEDAHRLQPPLAGLCVDTLGTIKRVGNGRLHWHETIQGSAEFVDNVGEVITRRVLRQDDAGYTYYRGEFLSTCDTLIGDPKYGFPCPWITTHYKGVGQNTDAYHSSADTMKLVSARGLATGTAAVAGYLYYLANLDTRGVREILSAETVNTLATMQDTRPHLNPAQAAFAKARHQATATRLKRWLWGGDRADTLAAFTQAEAQIEEAEARLVKRHKKKAKRLPVALRQVPRRTALLTPTMENTPPAIAAKISGAGIKDRMLYWADGVRTLAEIAGLVEGETSKPVEPEKLIQFFAGHAELGYVDLIQPADIISPNALVKDLKRLGLRAGMEVMVHSSLAKIGHVSGGANAVIDALLKVLGKRGTLLMPTFCFRQASVYNPQTTPSRVGAITDAMWRRTDAVRSDHASHSVAAIGARAEYFCADHLEVGIWAEKSPIGKLVHEGGHILSLGVTHNSSTAYHIAEISMPCGCLEQSVPGVDRVVDAQGKVRKVAGLAWRDGGCPVSPHLLDAALDKKKLQRHGLVGKAPASLTLALDVWKTRRAQLKNACPTCTVKPEQRG